MQLLGLLLVVLLQAQDKAPAAVALKGAKVYPGSGAAVEGATIVIEKGRISAVGNDLPIPPGAEILDVTGKVILPGLIDPASRLFLPLDGETSAGSADQRVVDGFDFYTPDAAEAREQGVTTVYVGPVSGGNVNGIGAVVHLGAVPEVLVREAALKLTLGASGGDTSSAAERYQSYPPLRQLFEGAKAYIEAGEKYRRDLAGYEQAKKDKKTDVKEPAKPKVDVRNEIVARCLDPQRPLTVRIEAHTADALKLALRLIEEFKLHAVLEYATEGGAVAEAIAKARVPVVSGPVFRLGPYSADYLNHTPATTALLAKAGVPAAIGSFGDERSGQRGPGGTRFLLESAAAAASWGMTREQALEAVTLQAARILGIDKTHGSIEKGKVADLVVLSGEPFEAATRVERTIVGGVVFGGRGKR
jgi:imidazolonepropionase-like amidohydrolase